MPNWFYFTLNVSGKEEDVQEFVQNVKGTDQYETEGLDFDFNHFIPQPDNIFRGAIGSDNRESLEEEGIPNWYDWNNKNWGTKWNSHCGFMDSDKTHATYHLETAWAFPSPVIAEMIEKYPDLSYEIEGEEEACSYGVYVKYNGGNLVAWHEEEPAYVDDYTQREVYYEDGLWKYTDDNKEVEDQDGFFCGTKYSWS